MRLSYFRSIHVRFFGPKRLNRCHPACLRKSELGLFMDDVPSLVIFLGLAGCSQVGPSHGPSDPGLERDYAGNPIMQKVSWTDNYCLNSCKIAGTENNCVTAT